MINTYQSTSLLVMEKPIQTTKSNSKKTLIKYLENSDQPMILHHAHLQFYTNGAVIDNL